ncbi:type II toxin-antitoxin system RelE/ParE family toxin [Polaribacter sp. NJDZ03]|uniref:type II toxin-antitoxin system RelE/ParE family toxin n=1 Tax=Polaribacter sp. NJDZ03 TaxID=2855841 RepID=UPI001C4A0891|nr:type II toxin-antitoxin system RelE/ParE family toxin [Polaribacter sp. NJDZ03]
MNNKITKVVWTRKAQESLLLILEYRYTKSPSVRKDIIRASKEIQFAEQFQKDDILPEYRRIIVRDYKLIYSYEKEIVYILNVICTKAN